VEKRRRCERIPCPGSRFEFTLKLDVIYLGSQSAPASLVISSLVRLYAEREDEDRARLSAPLCCSERKKIPGCVFSAPVLQSRARAWDQPGNLSDIQTLVPSVYGWSGKIIFSIAAVCKERRYICSRVLKSRNSRFKGSRTTNRRVYVCVHAYAPCLHQCLYVSVDGYLKEQARSVSKRKCLGAMPEPNGIKSTSQAA